MAVQGLGLCAVTVFLQFLLKELLLKSCHRALFDLMAVGFCLRFSSCVFPFLGLGEFGGIEELRA